MYLHPSHLRICIPSFPISSPQYVQEFEDSFIPLSDPRQEVVERVIEHLAHRNQDIPQLSDVSWTVHVVDSPTVNAFVLPVGPLD